MNTWQARSSTNAFATSGKDDNNTSPTTTASLPARVGSNACSLA
jgi:hypothetical protein